MGRVESSKVRCIAFLGHGHCGKTSLAEQILYKNGVTNRLGKVEEGNTISDFHNDEIDRVMSINSSFMHLNYKSHLIFIADTPGYADFVGDAISALRSVETGVVVIDASEGAQVGTERALNLIEKEKITCCFFINKIDKDEELYFSALSSLKEAFGNKVIAIHVPKDGEVINLLEVEPDNLDDRLKNMRQELIDSIAETNDELLEKYLEGKVSLEEEIAALKEAIDREILYPVFCGSSLTGEGIDKFLTAVVNYLPSPLEINRFDGIPPDEKGKFAAQVFKTVVDPYVGQLSLLKIFSGTLKQNDTIYNITQNSKERAGTLYLLQGKEQVTVNEAGCGYIVAVPKLKSSATNDIFSSDPKAKIPIPELTFPPSLISLSVKPKNQSQEDKLAAGIHRLSNEDPTFRVQWDKQTKETIISGMGGLHLDIMVKRLQDRFSVEVEMGTPRVPYKETIRKPVKIQGKYKKQTGGHGQYGDVWLEITPMARDGGFVFEEKIFGGAVPKQYIPSVEKGVRKAMNEGVLAGYPVVDVKVVLYDGSYHDVDSSDMAFQIAGAMAFKKGCEQANPVLLEPIMNVVIIAPDEFTGAITGDLNSRRGRVMGMEPKGKNTVITAQVPLSEMFSYSSQLRSITSGRGSFTMELGHYQEVPSKIAERVIAEAQREKEAATA